MVSYNIEESIRHGLFGSVIVLGPTWVYLNPGMESGMNSGVMFLVQ